MMNGFRVISCGDISRPVKLSRRDVEAEETWCSPEGENSTVDVNGGLSESFVILNGSRWAAAWGQRIYQYIYDLDFLLVR